MAVHIRAWILGFLHLGREQTLNDLELVFVIVFEKKSF
jgi:hypothetical protein